MAKIIAKTVTPVEKKVVTKNQGPFSEGSRDGAFESAMSWATENNIDSPEVSVGFDNDANKYEAWVTYETTE